MLLGQDWEKANKALDLQWMDTLSHTWNSLIPLCMGFSVTTLNATHFV